MDEWYEDFAHSEYTQSPLHRVATPELRWFLGRGHHPQRRDGLLTGSDGECAKANLVPPSLQIPLGVGGTSLSLP